MALNFGLGFSFRGNDLGLGKAINGLSRDFRTLGKEMLGLQRLQTMLSALSFDRLGELGDKFKTLSTGSMELTSSIESTFTAFDKETRKLGATMGYTGKELTKFKKEASGMAYSMNIGADQAGKAIYGFDAVLGDVKAADILKDMGIDSAATLAKLAEVAGVSSDKFSYSLLQMGKKISPKDVSQITDMLTAFGTKSGDVTASLGKLDDITSILSKRKMLGDTPEQIAEFGKGIVATADAFYSVTGNGEKAMAVATGLATALTDGKQGFKDLAAGATSALHESTLAFAKAGTGIDDAFASMSESPDVFLKKFAGAVDKLGAEDAKAAVEFFRAHASKAFGESGNDIVNMLQSAEGRLALTTVDVGKMVAASAKATGKLAKDGFTTGLTAAEMFERQQQGFLQRFRGLATQSTNSFLKETQSSFNWFATKMEDVAKDGGPLGMVLGKLADVQKFGATALFPANIQGPMIALGSAAEALTGPLAKLRAAGINLTSPFGALLGVFGGIAAMFASNFVDLDKKLRPGLKKLGASSGEIVEAVAHAALQKTGAQIIKFMTTTLPVYASKAIKFVSKFARKVLSGGLGDVGQLTGNKETDAILNGLIDVFKDAFDKAFKFVKEVASGFFDGLMGDFVDPKTASDGAVIGAAIGDTMRKAFDYALETLGDYLVGWWARMGEIWDDPNKTFEEKVKAWFGESLPLLIAGSILAVTFLGPITAALVSAFATLAVTVLKLLGPWMWKKAVWPALKWLASQLWRGFTGIIQGIAGAITAASAIVIAAFVAFFAGMFAMAQQEGDTFTQTWDRMWNNIFTTVEWYGDHIGNFLSYIGQNTLTFFENIGAHIANFFMAGFDVVHNAFAVVFNFVREYSNKLATLISAPLTSIIQTIGDLLIGLGKTISESPGLAKFFGIDSATIANIKKAGEWLQSTKKSDVAAALSDPKMERTTSTPLAIKAYRGLDASKVQGLGARQLEMNGPEKVSGATAAEIAQGRKNFAAFRARTSVPDLTPSGSGVLSGNGAGNSEWSMLQTTNKENSAALVAAVENPKWAEEQRARDERQTAVLELIAKVLQEDRASPDRARSRGPSPAANAGRVSPPARLSPALR